MLQSAAPLLKASAKVENLTISELNEFVITAPSQVLPLALGFFFITWLIPLIWFCIPTCRTLTSCVLGKLLASGWTKGGVMLFALKCTKNGNAQTQHSHVCTATI